MCESSNKRPVKIAESEERTYVLNFGWCGPIFDSRNFNGVHACHPLFNDYPQVINAGCYDYAEKGLDSAVMTMRAESSISHGLIIRVINGR
jgi:hypothetical protein